MVAYMKYSVAFAILIASCNEPTIANVDPPSEVEDSIFDLQWASLMDSQQSIVSLADGLIHQGMYIKAGSDGLPRLMAFDLETGEKAWQRDYPEIGDNEIIHMFVADGVLICRNSFTVFAVDIGDQSIRWSKGLGSLNYRLGRGTVLSTGEYCLIADENFDPLGGQTNHVLRFDPHNGEMDIVVSYAPDSIGTKSTSPPVYWRDDIIVYNLAPNAEVPPDEGHQQLVAYDMAAGEEVWRVPVIDKYASNSLHPPAIYDDRIVITGGGHHIFGFDLETGQQLWKYNLPGHTFGGGFWTTTNHLVHNNRLYINALSEEVTCLDPSTGREMWNNPKGGANCSDNMVLYEKENVLVLTSWGYGSVMILDADTGETLHREHRYEDVSYSNDPVYDEETDMFFTSTYQHAVAFKVRRPNK